MAITKIKPIRGTVNKALAYILDPQKTDDAFYVSSYGYAASDAAAKEFEWTRNLAVQQGMQMPKVLARHLIQSFDIGEVTPEEAHEVGKQLADELGRPYTTITKYENGEREPSLEYLKEIALKFNVSTDYLLGIEKTATPSRCDSSFYETLVNELASEGHKISETDLRFLEIIFKAITNWFLSAEHFSNENG